MDFPEHYFRPEVRDGFYVDGMMKKDWAEQIEVLNVIAEICARHDIRWYADNGTLLGAVRHGGFIPWDDDLDICMLRDDYERFEQVVNKELPEGYHFLSYKQTGKTDRLWDALARVVNTNTIHIDSDFLNAHHQFPYPAGVDIFYLDFLPPEGEQRDAWVEIASLVRNAELLEDRLENPDDPEVQAYMESIENLTGYRFHDKTSIRFQVYRLADAVFSMYGRDECSEVILTPYYLMNGSHVYQTSWYEQALQIQFENIMIPVPLVFDAVLETEYGKGYGIPNRGPWIHEYPSYQKLEKEAVRVIGWNPFHYHLDEKAVRALEDQYRHGAGKDGKKGQTAHSAAEKNGGKILFVIPHASHWKFVEPYYRILKQKPENEFRLAVPVYYETNLWGVPGEKQTEIEEIQKIVPKDLPVVAGSGMDFSSFLPDEIVFSDGFDSFNGENETIDPFYYASSLREMTSHLTYVSPFVTDEPSADDTRADLILPRYVDIPGVLYADKVLVQSEGVKYAYGEKIQDFYVESLKEHPEFEKILSKDALAELSREKIGVLPGQKEVVLWRPSKDEAEIPEEWKAMLKKPDGSWKKAVYVNMTLGAFFRDPERAIRKFRQTGETFRENREQTVLYLPNGAILSEAVGILRPDLKPEFDGWLSEMRDSGYAILDDSGNTDRALTLCDAYYGSPDADACAFRDKGLPVMLLNLSVGTEK